MNTLERVADTIRKNPEGLLILGAGVALMLRNASAFSKRQGKAAEPFDPYRHNVVGRRNDTNGFSDKVNAASETVSTVAKDARDYVTGAAADIGDKASEYGRDLADAASEYGRATSDHTRKAAQSALRSAENVMDSHPMSIALAGVAAGCLAAAVFPSTQFERENLGPLGRRAASDTGAFVKAAATERVARAAVKATDQIREAVSERRLNADTVGEVARDVAKDFASNLAGREDDTTKKQSSAAKPKAQL
jgi:hypothetical protein